VIAVRGFEDRDWQAIWPIFSEVVAAGDTYAYDPGWSEEEARAVWVLEPPGATVVAFDGDEVLGTAQMGPNRPGPGSHVATASFMVASGARGRGVGRRLGEYVVDWTRSHRYHAIQFNAVVETNEPAVELWKSLGFRVIGTVPEAFAHPEHGLVGLHVMYLKL
jgi:GNAT superfamily N-acetyltransferase